jgi:hypothetical protein
MISENTRHRVGGDLTDLEADLAGRTVNDEGVDTQMIRVSGSLDAHYVPEATVVLDRSPVTGQGLIAMAGAVAGEGIIFSSN